MKHKVSPESSIATSYAYLDRTAGLGEHRAETRVANVVRLAAGALLHGRTSAHLRVKVKRRRDKVDVLRDMLGKVVRLLARDLLRAALVLVHVVLGSKQRLGLCDSYVRVEPAATGAKTDTLRRDTAQIGRAHV